MLKGAGDMYSTATDLMKWLQSFTSTQIASQSTKKRMFEWGVATGKNSSETYGYGWYIDHSSPLRLYHGGGTWGYSTYSATYPDDKVDIVMLSNVSTLPVSSIAADVEKIVFGLPFTMPVTETVVQDSVDSNLYLGSYTAEMNGMVLTIGRVKDRMYVKLGSNPPFEIYTKGNHQFFGKKVAVDFTFQLEEGAVTGLLAERGGQVHTFRKDKP
jgi:CubicO group peptidase (beta-lactamase class C family)